MQVALPAYATIAEAMRFVLHGSAVRLTVECVSDIELLWGDKQQLDQLFGNIALNAKQSMPNGGVLAVTLNTRLLASDEIPDCFEGTYIEIAIDALVLLCRVWVVTALFFGVACVYAFILFVNYKEVK